MVLRGLVAVGGLAVAGDTPDARLLYIVLGAFALVAVLETFGMKTSGPAVSALLIAASSTVGYLVGKHD